MKTFTVHAVTWKTRLSNSIWTWKPIAPAATGWPAISYGCGESAFALLLFQRLRTLALQGTELANATAATIRQRLLKIGALVRVRRLGQGQHAPGLRSAGVGLSPSEALCTGSSCSGRFGGRRRLNSRVANRRRFRANITRRRAVSGALSDFVEIRGSKAQKP